MQGDDLLQPILATVPPLVGIADPIGGLLLAPIVAHINNQLTKYELGRHKYFVETILQELKEKWGEDIKSFLESEDGQYILKKCWEDAIIQQDKLKLITNINIFINACYHPDKFKQIDYYHSVLISLAAIEKFIIEKKIPITLDELQQIQESKSDHEETVVDLREFYQYGTETEVE
jgi:hypothetical protein